MIYLVSRNKTLFRPEKYQHIPFEKAMDFLLPLKRVQFDTETMGLDAHTKDLLTVQLGNKDNQVVFDWTTLTECEKRSLKDYLESGVLVIGVNLMFDLCFMYVQGIYPKKIYDIMLAEQLIYLGYPKIITNELYNELGVELPGYEFIQEAGKLPYYELSYSLKAMAKRYLNIDIDKTVRGKIINDGLTEDVIVYAAGDVMYLEDILDKQMEELKLQDLVLAAEFECEFAKSLAYVKHCGVHLDVAKWKNKMAKDLLKLKTSEQELNDWVVEWDSKRVKNGDWDIRYPEMDYDKPDDIAEEERRLLKDKYIRSPKDDLEVPYQSLKLKAYKKKVSSLFTKIDLQGDLFSGFNDKPQCVINWSSSKQVIKLFEILGIEVDTFDKKTKKKKKSVEAKMLKPQKDKFPIIPIYLRYQEAAKVVSTYGENWLKAINPKTGRVHADLHVIGTDTSRISSGGGPYKVNVLNLPRDKETRACFTSEKGNLWVSCDYTGQESAITASVSNDQKMINILESGGDMHSEVAKMCWPDLLGKLTVEEVKTKYKGHRQNAKAVEFAIFYGGDDNTLHVNSGFDKKDAKNIYDNFMKGFSGIAEYQDYCRKAVMRNGYILMNPITKHRAHIFDAKWMFKMQDKFKEDGYWEYYREMKRDAPGCDTVQQVTRYFRRKSDSEKQSINYRIQNRGAMAFKLAMIKLFNWIMNNNLIDIVLLCVTPYDEINLECPESIAEDIANVLVKCLADGGKPFCTRVHLGADVARMSKCHTNFSVADKIIMENGDVVDCLDGVFYNITKNTTYPESEVKGYKDYIEADGPLPNYWIH